MSIEKESSGLPEVDPHQATTKVNLWMIVGIGIFVVAMALVVWFMASHASNPAANRPSPSQSS